MMMLHSKACSGVSSRTVKCAASRPGLAKAVRPSAAARVASVDYTIPPLTAVSPLLEKLQLQIPKGQVYGKPLSKSELAAAQAAISHLDISHIITTDGLRTQLMSVLREAATTKSLPLNVIEGSMVLLEQLYLMEARPTGQPHGVMNAQEMLCRWQLVIGADVGSIQYIPVVEEFEVFPDGTSFALDTDLGVLFTGFSGDASWLSPGHVRYHVRRVRLELRLPKTHLLQELEFWKTDAWDVLEEGLMRLFGDKFWKTPSDAPPEKHHGKGTCRPDQSKPAVTIPLPFPENELFIFASDGDLGVLRSKLGGLILLVNKTPVAERSKLGSA